MHAAPTSPAAVASPPPRPPPPPAQRALWMLSGVLWVQLAFAVSYQLVFRTWATLGESGVDPSQGWRALLVVSGLWWTVLDVALILGLHRLRLAVPRLHGAVQAALWWLVALVVVSAMRVLLGSLDAMGAYSWSMVPWVLTLGAHIQLLRVVWRCAQVAGLPDLGALWAGVVALEVLRHVVPAWRVVVAPLLGLHLGDGLWRLYPWLMTAVFLTALAIQTVLVTHVLRRCAVRLSRDASLA